MTGDRYVKAVSTTPSDWKRAQKESTTEPQAEEDLFAVQNTHQLERHQPAFLTAHVLDHLDKAAVLPILRSKERCGRSEQEREVDLVRKGVVQRGPQRRAVR